MFSVIINIQNRFQFIFLTVPSYLSRFTGGGGAVSK